MFYLLLSFSVVVLAIHWAVSSRRGTGARLPPGPAPLPIVGNIMDLPAKGKPEYQHWLKFKDKYGPVSSVTVLGQTMVILHDRQAVEEILEKTAAKSSGRPYLTFAAMCGFHDFLSLMGYTPTWRQHRRMVHQQIGTKKTAAQFNDVQDTASRRLVLRIIEDPQGLISHIKIAAAAIILKMTYGYSIHLHQEDPLVLLIEKMMDNASKALVPGSWLVDFVPWIRLLPSWLPGMQFKATAKGWSKITQQVTNMPYEFVQDQMHKGVHQPSYISNHIEQATQHNAAALKIDSDMEEAIKRTAAVMYAGGADTTVSVISAFFLAMIMFPDVQRKAQAEIDTVIGSNRLPEMQDQDQLPYVSAVVKEALRWFPIAPMGVGHSVDEDIPYQEYVIPKGSIIMPATWWFHNDPLVYANPSVFDPERFIGPRNEPDPAGTAFGHGRRTCPGKFVADMSLFWTISRILAVLDIRKAVDEHGVPIEVQRQFLPGLLTHPAKFAFDITARSPAHAKLAEELGENSHLESQDAEALNFEGW